MAVTEELALHHSSVRPQGRHSEHSQTLRAKRPGRRIPAAGAERPWPHLTDGAQALLTDEEIFSHAERFLHI